MKEPRGTKKFKSYRAMCAALEIPIKKRGKDKTKQLEDLGKLYYITKKKNGSFEITKINRAMRSEEKKNKKIASGQIATIDGVQVDLRGRGKYKDTGIYDYVYFKTFSGTEFTPWQFSKECFQGMVYFRKRYCFEDRADIDSACKEQVRIYGDSMISSEIRAITRSILMSLDKNKDYDFYLGNCYYMSNGCIISGINATEIGRLYHDCYCMFSTMYKGNPYLMHKNNQQLLDDIKNDYFRISGQNEIFPQWHCFFMGHSHSDSNPTSSPKENLEILCRFFGVLRETLKYETKKMETTAHIALGEPPKEMLKPEEQELLIKYLDRNIRLDPNFTMPLEEGFEKQLLYNIRRNQYDENSYVS